MLIIVVTISTFVVLFTTIMRRRSFPLSLSVTNMANLAHVCCIVLYIAIMGGLASRDVRLLFLNDKIMHWMKSRPINLYRLGYVTSLTRLLVPFGFVMSALDLSRNFRIKRHRHGICLVVGGGSAILAVLYEPTVYKWVVIQNIAMLSFLIRFAFLWILMELVLALGILICEYREISIRVFQRNFFYIMLAVFSQMMVYLIFATKDPTQIYNLFITEYLNLGISNYISPSLSSTGWIFLMFFVMAGALLGAWGIVRYEHFQFSEEREYAVLEQQFFAADMGISVFAHSIKNQLLSTQVLLKRMRRELAKESPEAEKLKELEAQMNALNESMKGHIDAYYAFINSKQLRLIATDATTLADASIAKFREKYPEGKVETDYRTGRKVLVDASLFTEAIYNLLLNAYEATREGMEEPKIGLCVRAERLWTVFAVSDNGVGVPDQMRKKIFQPFLTGKSKNTNWGMGLFYTNRIVRQHFGRLKMESRVGKGSTFMILLPALQDEKIKEA